MDYKKFNDFDNINDDDFIAALCNETDWGEVKKSAVKIYENMFDVKVEEDSAIETLFAYTCIGAAKCISPDEE